MKKSAADILLRLGDDYLILGQRLSEWCGHAPMLEEDIALTNIALDSFGAAQLIYTELISAGVAKGSPDDLAFGRNEREYLNCLLVEQPNGDFAHTIVRQFFFDAFAYHMLLRLATSGEPKARSVASKLQKEKTYHLRHSGAWIMRLADGTAESRGRIEKAIHLLWKHVPELFFDDEVVQAAHKDSEMPLCSSLKGDFLSTIAILFERTGMKLPELKPAVKVTGRSGIHTEHLGHLLSEMQILRRSYPGATW